MNQMRCIRSLGLALLALALWMIPLAAVAEEASKEDLQGQINDLQEKINQLEKADNKVPDWVKKIDISGDFQTRWDIVSAKFDDQVSLFKLMGSADEALQTMQDQLFEMAVPAVIASGNDPNIVNIQNQVQEIMMAMPPEQVQQMLAQFGAVRGHTANNDSLFTNRLRLNIKAKVAKNVDFKGRLAMYKIWGMESADPLSGQGILFPMKQDAFLFDAGPAHVPSDNTLRVDRAYANWNEMFGAPLWFSVGRRPTTGGPPMQLRQGLEFHERQASPAAHGIDYAFDGMVLGLFMKDDWYPFEGGKFRLCFGKGFEAGFEDVDGQATIEDALFYGISYDIVNDKEKDLFVYLQSFIADGLPDSLDVNSATNNLGDIYQTTGVVMHKISDLEYFLSTGWSVADPNGFTNAASGMFDEQTLGFLASKGVNMEVGMLTNPGGELKTRHGWSIYTGVRYPVLEKVRLGAEYNYGSKYWVGFSPSDDDDLWNAKTATRGHVAEVYSIVYLPVELIDLRSKAFFRLGYQYYDFEYTGSGSYLGEPINVDDLSQPGTATVMAGPDYMHQGYISFNVYF